MPFGTFSLNDGNEIPAIAYGTGSVWKWQDVTPLSNEEGVAAGIKESGLERSDLYITTKFGGRDKDVTEGIQVSLKNLGVKHVDLYLIHSPGVVGSDLEGVWRKMEQTKEDGYAKSIGVSNFDVGHLQRILKMAKIIPAVNQIALHPYNYKQMLPTLQYCKQHNIVVEAYSSLTPITKAPGGPVDPIIEAIAKNRNATPAQIIQLWVSSKDIVIVTTSSKKERLQEYLAVADLAPLTREEILAIEEAGAQGPPSAITAVGRRVKTNMHNTIVGFAVLVMLVLFIFARRKGVC
ncbi:NADP-dependent oxidoreductase domain-containing protein [Mucidula mucida]|nr:NADP-dependent oxidoreductase domain-containing protein [Mucidula mucida]